MQHRRRVVIVVFVLAASLVMPPAPAGAADTMTVAYATGTFDLTGVSCPTASFCVAIGDKITKYDQQSPPFDVDSQGRPVVAPDTASLVPAVVTITNGNVGSPQEIPGLGQGGMVDAVSCSSAANCVATGRTSAGALAVVAITNGAPGSAQPGPQASPLSSLSCPTSDTCFAANGAPATISGGAITPGTDPPGSSIFKISCPSGSTSCLGLGDQVDSTTGNLTYGVWSIDNGTPGSFQPVPAVTAQWDSISCPSLQNCYAVGEADTPFLIPLVGGAPGPSTSVPLSPEQNSVVVGVTIGCAPEATCVIVSPDAHEADVVNGSVEPAQATPLYSGSNGGLDAVSCPTTTCVAAGTGSTPAAIPPGDSPYSDGASGAFVSIAVNTNPPPRPCTAAPSSPAPSGIVVRLAGIDRDHTAIQVSNAEFSQDGSAAAVVLASDVSYPDALAGTPLAAAKHGPLLLNPPDSVADDVLNEISRVLPQGKTVYILGGDGALDPSIDASLQQAGYQTQRLAGANRFATAVAIAGALGDPGNILEATGVDFPDALSAGAAAVKTSGAVLLTNGSSQSAESAAYLSAHPSDMRTAVGGPAATADPTATPLVGGDRFATAVTVAQHIFGSSTTLGFASAFSFPDALAGGAHVGSAGGPMLLVPPCGPLPSPVMNYLGSVHGSVTSGSLYGGTAAVGDDVLAELDQAA